MNAEQKLTAAYMYIVRGVSQQDLAAIYNVNSGRIAEAVQAARSVFK